MKRILIFSTTYLPFVGGAEVAISEITKRMPETHFDIVTVNLSGAEASVSEEGNTTIYRIGSGKFGKLFFPFTALKLGIDLHKKEPYDCVWSVMASYAGVAGMWFKKKNAGVPFVLTLQEGDSHEELRKKFRFVWPLFKNIFSSADHIQAISEYLAQFAREMDANASVSVVPNGVDTERFAPDGDARARVREEYGYTDEQSVLVSTSRLVPKNGIDTIIRALSLLPDHVVLHLVGSGEKEMTYKTLAGELGVSERIVFVGSVSPEAVPMHVHAGDVFVRPSRSEGFGNAFVEAMAARVPVIGTPVGGIVDFLDDKETGIFCEPDNPESLAEAVNTIINDDELRKHIVESAEKMARERYDWDVITERMKKSVLCLSR